MSPVSLPWCQKGQLLYQGDEFCPVAAEINTSDILILLGDCNDYIGKSSAGYETVHGGHCWGTRNAEGRRLLEFAVSYNVVIGKTCFKNPPMTWSLSHQAKKGLRSTMCAFIKPSSSMWEMPSLSLARRSPSSAPPPSASLTICGVKTWISKVRNLSAMTLESFAWMTGTSTPSFHQPPPPPPHTHSQPHITHPFPQPHPPHPHIYISRPSSWWNVTGLKVHPDHSWNAESLWSWMGPANPWSNRR